jgi:hypothetical protein
MGSDSERDYLVVAAIDFGSTYSGFAYSFRDDPTKIHSPCVWYAGDSGLAAYQTPTCLLLNPDRTFNSFGFKAENKFAELCANEEHHDFYYFQKFKMELHYKVGSIKGFFFYLSSVCLCYHRKLLYLPISRSL